MLNMVAVFFFGATLLMIICGLLAWHAYRQSPASRTLLAFCLLLGMGMAGQILVYTARAEDWCRLGYHISWIGWSIYPALSVMVAIFITHETLSRQYWMALLFLPALLFVWHGATTLIGISGFTPTPHGTFLPVYAYRPWDLAYVVYQYSFDLLALGVIGVWGIGSGNRRKRRQAVIILSSALLAILIDGFHYVIGSKGMVLYLWAVEQIIFAVGLSFAVTRYQLTAPTTALAAKNIVDQVVAPILLTTMDGIILQSNRAALSLLEVESRAVLGRSIRDFITEDQPVAPVAQRTDLPEDVEQYDAVLHTASGGNIPVRLSCSVLCDTFGDAIGRVIVGEDLRKTRQLEQEIQERVKAEEALRATDRAKNQFLATLSHELLTPLTIIFCWLELANSNTELIPQGLDIIERNARRQHRLVADLLDISRIIHGKFTLEYEEIDLTLLAAQCVEEFRQVADQHHVKLDAVLPDGPLLLRADPARMRQAVGNILSNAIRCTPSEGRVTLTVDAGADWGWLIIADTGCGISPDDLPYIFTPFIQGAGAMTTGSLGLGLAVVKGIVELHGGTVTAVSPNDVGGSTFTIALPVHAAEPQPV